MYYEAYTGSEIAKTATQLAEHQAVRNWRFRNHHSRATKAIATTITTVVTSVLGFLLG
jgi:hypothetical protein